LSYVLEVVVAGKKRGLLDGGHVVVAAGDERGLALAQARGLDTVINDVPELGLSHSLRLGLSEIEARTGEKAVGALVFLGDQPLVRLDVVEALVAGRRGPIVRPRYEDHPDTPGHPVLLDRSIWTRALHLEGDDGFRAPTSSASTGTVLVDVKGDNPDVDTPADLDTLEGYAQ
jgi:CTP:molybdopterin cytidylyltransferase MocA